MLSYAWQLLLLLQLLSSRAAESDRPPRLPMDCNAARIKCMYRVGCRKALESYLTGCRSVVNGEVERCGHFCTMTLIALTSTRQGSDLMQCDCGEDQFCQQSKQRLLPCQSAVIHATRSNTSVTCEAAQWICGADSQCGVALDYYYRNCRAMFDGRRCTARCNNSIAILQRQPRAAKLRTCQCHTSTRDDGCRAVKTNMQTLCFPSVLAESHSTASDRATGVNHITILTILTLFLHDLEYF